jgi:lipopolysaccharide export system permease protein
MGLSFVPAIPSGLSAQWPETSFPDHHDRLEQATGSAKGRQLGRFDRYILSQLMLSFGFFSLVLIGVYWINQAVILLDQYIAEGGSGSFVLELTLLSLPRLMLLVLPIAAFVASVFVTNRLYSDSELVVMQATGFSAFRLARPYLMFGLLIALLISTLAHLLVPASARQLNAREAELTEAASARILTPGNFESPVEGVSVYVRDIAADGTVEDLLLTDRREAGRETTYTADRALLVRDPDGPKLIMFDGMAQSLELPEKRLSVTRFTDFTIAIGSLIESPSEGRMDSRELTTPQLLAPSEELLEQTRRSRDYLQREGHLRFTQALLSIGASVIGFAALMVGGFSRFGLWRQIALAVLLVVFVKLIDNSAIDVAKARPDDWPVVYLASVVAGLISVLLLWIANGNLLTRLKRRRA